MKRICRLACAAALAVAAVSFAQAAEIAPKTLDPRAVAFLPLDDIQWKANPTNPGAQNAVVHGDPTKPGLYVVLTKWLPGNMSRPHFHPNDRFITVLKGVWWVGSGPKYDPDSTVPMKAGTVVTHFAKGVHYDGAKDEEAVILIVGEGPADSTRVTQ